MVIIVNMNSTAAAASISLQHLYKEASSFTITDAMTGETLYEAIKNSRDIQVTLQASETRVLLLVKKE